MKCEAGDCWGGAQVDVLWCRVVGSLGLGCAVNPLMYSGIGGLSCEDSVVASISWLLGGVAGGLGEVAW